MGCRGCLARLFRYGVVIVATRVIRRVTSNRAGSRERY